MKRFIYITTAILFVNACGNGISTDAKVESSMDSFSYAVGVSVGKNFKSRGIEEISYNAMIRGLKDGMTLDSNFLFDEDAMNNAQRNFIKQAEEKKTKAVKENTANRLKEISNEKGVSVLPSKAYYKLLQAGSGVSPNIYDTVICKFVFKNSDGEVVVDNRDSNDPFKGTVGSFNLDPVEEAMLKTMKGGKFKVYISNEETPALSRSARSITGMYGISEFEMELVDIIPGTPSDK